MTISEKTKRTAHALETYIENNLGSPLSISLLAKEFGISDFTLKKIFRTAFNKPVHHFIMEKRMQKARQLLLETDFPIKQIAAVVGFKRTTAFFKAFHKQFNISPGALRK